MATEPFYTPAPRTGVLRDAVAILLIIICVAGLAWVGFATDWRLGVLVLSVAAGVLGVGVGLSR